MSDLREKIERIIEAAAKAESDAVVHIHVEHDPGCPAIRTQRLMDCACAPVVRKTDERTAVENRGDEIWC